MKLKELRKGRNLTQDEVAKKIGIGRDTYKNYEQQRTEMGYDMLIKIADFFGCSTDHLLEHSIPHQIDKFQYSTEQLAVIEELEKLDKEQCYALLAFIEGMKSGKEQQNKILAKFHSNSNEV